MTKLNVVNEEDYILNTSYEQLSQEFQETYPTAVRAFELVGLMYNRLTIVDKLSHKEAVSKIYNDHKHLQGFSRRNITRYLPSDNPKVPRRVRTSCPKNSITENDSLPKISATKNTIDSGIPNPSLSNNVINNVPLKNNTISFEFSLPWKKVSDYMSQVFNSPRKLEVWFSGIFDKQAGKIIAVNTGRMIDQTEFGGVSSGRGVD